MRFLFLLLFCSSTLACEKPITINYGPFVSLLVVEQFFGGFHHSLAEKTGCKVNFQLHKNFDDYLLSLFTREYPIALTPGPYHDVMVQLGYKLISTESSNAPRKHYLIVKKNRNINNLNDLVGRKVLVLSPLSSSGSFFIESLSQQNLLSKIEIHYNNAYESMVISVLKGDFDAAVVIQDYWTLIAESLRENQLSVIKVYEIKPDSNFYGRDSYSELTPNIFPDFKTGSVSWGEPSPNKNPAKLLRTLLQQKLDQFNDQQSK